MLANKKTTEASGICKSIQHDGIYWVHNDSGNKPIFYATNEKGENIKEFPLNIKTIDTEDCSSGLINGVPTIILGDFGDNKLKRKVYTIYVFTEPSDLSISQKLEAKIIKYSYPDNKSRNCEACSLLPNGTINVITKSYPIGSGHTTKYNIKSWLSGHENVYVTKIREFSSRYGIITAMDTFNDVDILLGGGYVHIFGNQAYKKVKIPKSPQPEALSWTHDGKSAIILSEQNRQISIVKIY
jgi:hypothetical protein